MAAIDLDTGTALAADCPAEVADPITVIDFAVCAELQDAMRDPAVMLLDTYENIYSRYFDN
ncbi:MAG: hypothetical protein GDA49_08155 [Rhodospirillales bacterium]|nr:hypothetical protein [Rhodospirillales bacterium]